MGEKVTGLGLLELSSSEGEPGKRDHSAAGFSAPSRGCLCTRSIGTRVTLPFTFQYEQPFRFKSDVGEEWLLDAHRLKDGSVILGVRATMIPANVEARFRASAVLFGSTVHEALNIPERSIDEAFDFAIVDSAGTLRAGIGGIPVKSNALNIPPKAEFVTSAS